MAAAKPNELRLIRVYDAPAKLVWAMWTEDKHITKWWGPRGFTLTTKSKDMRPGGKWIYTMHGPDGVDYPNITTYHAVEPYKKLVYDHGGNEDRLKLFTVTVTFEEHQGKTVMDMTMALDTPEAAKEIKKFIKQAGGNATWDRLAEYLEHEKCGKDPFVINRTFEAPIEKVFEMWTNPKHFSKWLPPTGFTMEYFDSEIKVGSTTFYKMTNGATIDHYGKMTYKEINPVHRLAYTQCFTDEKGNLSKPPFEKNWPDTVLATVTFAEEGSNETRVTVVWEVYDEASEIEMKTFRDARAGMTMGWSGSFDKLDELLK
ncbi:MAG: SRPBCC family protein [Bacteriovoracaceae bacterium]